MVEKFKTIWHHTRPVFIPQSTVVFNQKCNYATWSTFKRLPEKGVPIQPNNLPVCPRLNLQIMPSSDLSGKSHTNLFDKDFIDPLYLKSYGVFSSSPFNINGPKAILISNINLMGKLKKQYFHPFPEPRLILKKDAILVEFSALEKDDDYVVFLRDIKKTFNLT